MQVFWSRPPTIHAHTQRLHTLDWRATATEYIPENQLAISCRAGYPPKGHAHIHATNTSHVVTTTTTSQRRC